MFEDGGDRTYHVVVNEEDQYSIWPADKPLPAGWWTVGFEGVKQECLRHIETLWTDMRPRSLRLALAEEADDR
ncbi:MbtH family protein [Streptomyces sp. NPDC015350]|uniref:MbtH family protein n=1 Tax=Streptomyces sp. NPDC015350 TaxID=3364955 RepID=UPI003700D90B